MRKSILLILFAIILISLCSCELSMEKPKQGKVHILVYGNDYRYMPSGRLNDTVNDAVNVGMALSKLCEKQQVSYSAKYIYGMDNSYDAEVSSLPNSEISHNLTYAYLIESMKNLTTGENAAKEGDLTFIFFSGHGFSDYPDKKNMAEYGADTASKGYFLTRKAESSEESIRVPVSVLIEKINAIPGAKVVFSDFCFSGTFVQAGYVSVTGNEYNSMDATKLFGLRSEICESSSSFYLSASRYYEKSWEQVPSVGTHGYFTKALLDAFGWDEDSRTIKTGGAYKNGRITFLDVANYTANNDNESRQNPMFSGGSNDIILFSF